jgi:hypothetical protein
MARGGKEVYGVEGDAYEVLDIEEVVELDGPTNTPPLLVPSRP